VIFVAAGRHGRDDLVQVSKAGGLGPRVDLRPELRSVEQNAAESHT
jgi:hypothetical protein